SLPFKPETLTVLTKQQFDAVLLGVAHKEFLDLDMEALDKEKSGVYEVKGILGNEVDGKL
ncbi:MAG: nucleotide sugar dehydrogenase, partial [Flavobacteriaceae bacterium CG_4_9_14_0_8_um_filter_34_30]